MASNPIDSTSKPPLLPVSSGSGQSEGATSAASSRDVQNAESLFNFAQSDYFSAKESMDLAKDNHGVNSPEYLQAKQNTVQAQQTLELAQTNLSQTQGNTTAGVTSADDSDNSTGTTNSDSSTDVDLTGQSDQTTSASATPGSTDAPPDGTQPDITVTGHKIDVRVRLRPKEQTGSTYPFFGDKDSVLYMLNETNGAFFPYTPTITMAHKVNYSQMTPTHANTDYYTYTNTPAVQIQIEGQFSAQNLDEARYTLACMHFFRSATKMHFGEYERKQGTAGLPPPPLVLSGYGEFMFNDLTVLLQDFSMALPNNVNYLEVTMSDGTVAWVPSLTTMTITCVVQQTPKQQREDFNLADFVNGKMFGHGSGNAASKGWI